MSSNPDNMINLSNYEEYFILYLDNELSAADRLMVEAFVAAHPHLEAELDLLLSTRLPVEEMTFGHKEDLLAPAMRSNVADESLLLYLDNELPPEKKIRVEEQLKKDTAYQQQYAALLHTKLTASEVIPYPNKQELYRHSEKAVRMGIWMRVAAAVAVVFVGTLFFLADSGKPSIPVDQAITSASPAPQNQPSTVPNKEEGLPSIPKDDPVLVTTGEEHKPAAPRNPLPDKRTADPQQVLVQAPEITAATATGKDRAVIVFDSAVLTGMATIRFDGIEKIPAHSPVTSLLSQTYNPSETLEEETGVDDNKIKKESARGFLRKVSRLIERNTGIGTVSADDELLIGALALKLK